MKKFKRIIGWVILLSIFPILAGIATLDGDYCQHGHVFKVIPFWELFFTIYLVELGALAIGIFAIYICRTFIE